MAAKASTRERAKFCAAHQTSRASIVIKLHLSEIQYSERNAKSELARRKLQMGKQWSNAVRP